MGGRRTALPFVVTLLFLAVAVAVFVNVAVTNFWDDGNEGNYWSDYNSHDNDGNRIGDNPYSTNMDNQDNYPLMEPTEIEVIPEFTADTPVLLILTVFAIILTMDRSRLNRKMKDNKCMSCKN